MNDVPHLPKVTDPLRFESTWLNKQLTSRSVMDGCALWSIWRSSLSSTLPSPFMSKAFEVQWENKHSQEPRKRDKTRSSMSSMGRMNLSHICPCKCLSSRLQNMNSSYVGLCSEAILTPGYSYLCVCWKLANMLSLSRESPTTSVLNKMLTCDISLSQTGRFIVEGLKGK